MHYRVILPTPALSNYLECFWTLQSRSTPSLLSPERILPDGCTEIIFNLAAAFKRYHSSNHVEVQPQSLFVGQMRRFAMIEPTGEVRLFGIRFRPAGAYIFTHFPLAELTDKIIDLDLIWNHFSRELTEKIHLARTTHERTNIVEKALLARLDRRHDIDRIIESAIDTIIARDGLVSIDRLQKKLQLSSRQLERKFQERVGLSPKFFCRILRLQKVFKAVASHRPLHWSFIATECGYFDQAHFIHDFKEFSGQTPAIYFSEAHEMSEHFTRKNRLSDFYNTNE